MRRKSSISPLWPPSTATGKSRKRTSSASTVSIASTMRGPKPSPITMPSMSRALSARAALSTLSAPTRPTRSPTRDRKLRIGAAAAGNQHGRFFQRVARPAVPACAAPCAASVVHAAQHRAMQRANAQTPRSSRRAIRSAGAVAEIASACRASARSSSSRMRAITGVNGAVAGLESARREPAPTHQRRLLSAQGSASTTASGSTEAIAAAASAQVVSTIGKHRPRATPRRHPPPACRQRRRTDLATPWRSEFFRY